MNSTQAFEQASLRMLEALHRMEALIPATAGSPTQFEALLFNLERAAWAMLEMAQTWVLDARLGFPKKETESLDLLQREGFLELDLARKLKQLAEFRNLSSREPGRIDADYLQGSLGAELELFRHWDGLAREKFKHAVLPQRLLSIKMSHYLTNLCPCGLSCASFGSFHDLTSPDHR